MHKTLISTLTIYTLKITLRLTQPSANLTHHNQIIQAPPGTRSQPSKKDPPCGTLIQPFVCQPTNMHSQIYSLNIGISVINTWE